MPPHLPHERRQDGPADCGPGAELIGFNISDSVSNPPTRDISIPWEHYYGTPMGPDQTTLQDALACIEKYDLSTAACRRLSTRYLASCGPAGETPKGLSPKYILSNQHLAGQRCGAGTAQRNSWACARWCSLPSSRERPRIWGRSWPPSPEKYRPITARCRPPAPSYP